MTTRNHLIAAVAIVGASISPLAHAQQLAPAQAAPIVKSIDVQYAGPATVSKEKVLANMRTAIGKPYSDSDVEEDIRNLYGTGNISNVRIFGEPAADGVKVIVVIQTKAKVKAIRWEGVSQVKTKSLAKLIATKPGQQLTEANLEADRQKILDHYHEKGFKDTTVTTKIDTDEKTNESTVVFQVSEAGKTIVRRIRFEGASSFKTSQLRHAIKTAPHQFLISYFTKAGLLKNDQLQDDVSALKDFYQNHGYLDVQVGEPQVERVDKQTYVDLIFPIKEGAQYHVGKMEVTGAQVSQRLKCKAGSSSFRARFIPRRLPRTT